MAGVKPSYVRTRPLEQFITSTAMQLHTDPALWHAYATHGGGRCSHYVGDYETAFSEGMRYYRLHGGKIHIERID